MAERLRVNPAVTVDTISEQRKHLIVQGFSILLTHGTDIKSLDNAAKQTIRTYLSFGL